MQKAPVALSRDEGQGAGKLHNFSTNLTPLDRLTLVLGNLEAAEQMQKRAIQDMVQMASADFWDRRAEAFASAVPKASDFHGDASAQEIADRAIRCKTIADQCRAHARILRGEFDD